jgi:hypothetical protein
MQNPFGTDKTSAVLVLAIGASGLPTVKSQLNCSLISGGTAGLGAGRYLVQLANGPIVVGGATSSGNNDNNTAVVVNQVRNGSPCQEVDVTFGPATSVLGSYAVSAGQIEIDFGAAGATNPASGSLITITFTSCFDGVDNTP